MIPSPTLPNEPAADPILDFWALQREGRDALAAMTDGQWTDFNTHDPGITILDVLCYALTDFGYRAFHDIPDLLASGRDERGGDGRNNVFGAAEVLTTRAVTVADLRKVALDVVGVKNVWFEPVTAPDPRLWLQPGGTTIGLTETAGHLSGPDVKQITLAGLYRVLIEKSDLIDPDATALVREVGARLHQERNLCEDFTEIVVLDTQKVAVAADIEIGPFESGDEIMLQVYERLAEYISPDPTFASLAAAQATGAGTEDIFDGPALQRGFIDTAALARIQRRTTLHVSDVIRDLAAIPGVRGVRRLWLTSGNVLDAVENWSLSIAADAAPVFDHGNSQINLYSRVAIKVPVDTAHVAAVYLQRRRVARTFPPLARDARDLIPAAGVDRDVGRYFPLANDFPGIYGLAPGSLSSSAPLERKVEVNQLRGYLAVFDQLLADQFALLAAVPGLLAFRDDVNAAYPSQPVARFAGEPGGTAAPLLSATDTVSSAGTADDWRRRNRLVNHLLARFGEDFPELPQRSIDHQVRAKQAFLRRFPRVSAARGTGYDYVNENGLPSGLEERIGLKLGLDAAAGETFLVIEHILLRPIADDVQQELPFLEAIAGEDPFSLQLSFVFPTAVGRIEADPDHAVFRPLIERVVREETPAHLVAHIHWLVPTAFQDVADAYQTWLSLRRVYVREGLHMASADNAGGDGQ